MSWTFEDLTADQLRDAIDFARLHGWEPGALNHAVCAHCRVKMENCKPGGQWYTTCPFNPTGGGHHWVAERTTS